MAEVGEARERAGAEAVGVAPDPRAIPAPIIFDCLGPAVPDMGEGARVKGIGDPLLR